MHGLPEWKVRVFHAANRLRQTVEKDKYRELTPTRQLFKSGNWLHS